jgi:class 3 adenylate cyclase
MVVIGENTYEMVKGQFNVNPLPKATLKGKEKEVGVFEVLSVVEGAAATPPQPGA